MTQVQAAWPSFRFTGLKVLHVVALGDEVAAARAGVERAAGVVLGEVAESSIESGYARCAEAALMRSWIRRRRRGSQRDFTGRHAVVAMVWLNNLGFADPYGTTSRAVDALFTQGARDLGNGFLVVRVGDDALLEATIDCLTKIHAATNSTRPTRCSTGSTRHVPRARCTDRSPHRPQNTGWAGSLADGVLGLFCSCARNGLYALVHAAEPRKVLAAAVTGPPGTIPYGKMSGGEMGDWCQKAGMAMAIEVLANGEKALRNRVSARGRGRRTARQTRGTSRSSFAAAPESRAAASARRCSPSWGSSRTRTALRATWRRREHATPASTPARAATGGAPLRRRQLQPPRRRRRHAAPAGRGGRARQPRPSAGRRRRPLRNVVAASGRSGPTARWRRTACTAASRRCAATSAAA